jgi:hypothetical protein
MKPPLDIERYKNEKRKLSILIDNPLPEYIGKRKESYVGCIYDYDDNFLVLDTYKNNKRLSGIAIRWEMILSIWIYHENIIEE